jgi:predicted RNA-binding Zn-ribbon protein involved in translation (DUF1610 family)
MWTFSGIWFIGGGGRVALVGQDVNSFMKSHYRNEARIALFTGLEDSPLGWLFYHKESSRGADGYMIYGYYGRAVVLALSLLSILFWRMRNAGQRLLNGEPNAIKGVWLSIGGLAVVSIFLFFFNYIIASIFGAFVLIVVLTLVLQPARNIGPTTLADSLQLSKPKPGPRSSEVPTANESKVMKFACPHCGQHIEADDTWLGLECACPSCSRAFMVTVSLTVES